MKIKQISTSIIVEKGMRMERPGPVSIYLLKVNNRNTRTRCEICSKLTGKCPLGDNLKCVCVRDLVYCSPVGI